MSLRLVSIEQTGFLQAGGGSFRKDHAYCLTREACSLGTLLTPRLECARGIHGWGILVFLARADYTSPSQGQTFSFSLLLPARPHCWVTGLALLPAWQAKTPRQPLAIQMCGKPSKTKQPKLWLPMHLCRKQAQYDR